MTKENNYQAAVEQPTGETVGVKKRIPLPTLINLLLFAGLIVLYGLYFLRPEKAAEPGGQQTLAGKQHSAQDARIAFVRSDVLMEEYSLAQKLRNDFEQEQNRLETDLSRRQRTFQNDMEGFQRNLNAGILSLDKAQERERELMVRQQEMMQLAESYRERLALMELEMNRELLDKISSFLEKFNLDSGYDYILGYTRGGGILHAESSHDITDKVLAGLNAEFASPQ